MYTFKYDENVYKIYKSDKFITSKFYFNSTVNYYSTIGVACIILNYRFLKDINYSNFKFDK